MSVAAGGVARSGLTALLALTLGALLLSSASPAGAQSGSGTVDYDTDGDNLIEVSTLAQLNAIRYDLDGNGTVASGDQANYDIAFPNALASMGCAATCTGYELTADLTFDENGDGQMTSAGDPTYWNGGSGWAPLGGNALPFRMDIVVTMFAGILEGNGHTISHLYINRPDHIAIGLFGVFRNPLSGVIRNLTLANVNVTGQSMVGPLVGYVSGPLEGVHVSSGRVSGVSNVGGLVGTVFRLGHVSGSHSAAAVTGAGANADLGKIGGLVGELYGKVTTSYATGSVTGPHVVGGLVGSIEIVSLVVGGFAMGEVNRSYATGAVSAPGSSAGVGGGLAGANAGHVKASYATGAVSGRGPIGGLIGNNKGTGVVTASYARGKVVSTGDKGGLTGQNSGTVTNSYWDTEATGQATIAGDGVGGQTRSALQTPTDYTGIYANWNLNLDSTAGADNPWDFGSNAMYPALKADFDGDGTPTSTEFGDSPVSAVPAFTEGAGPVSRSVPENTEQKADKNIGLPAGAEDANNQDTLTYTLDGTNAAHFDIDASSGRLQAKGALDFEGTPNYQVIVRVRDGRDALASVEDPPAIDDTIVVDISVTDVNEPPEFGVVGPFTPDENQTAVGTVPAAVDPDAGASLTYEIMEGAGDGDHALFDFNVGTRVLTFEKAPDYEATPTKITYTVKIRVKDGKDAQGTGGSLWDNTVTVTINLQNVNEPPDAPTNVGAVGIANGLRVTWTAPVITVEPAVDGYDVEYSLRTSADGVNPATWGAPTTSVAGVVTTHDILTLTPRSTYRVRVRAENDDGKGDWSSYVNGVPNDPPLINAVPSFDDGADTTRSVPENTAAGTAIGNPIAATAANAADTLVYAIDATSGDHAHFDIDTSTGQLEVKGALDYEAVKNSYTVTVQVRDSLNAAGTADTAWDASIEVTIAVDDANEKPAFAGNADTTPAVAEGATAVGTYAATDPESDSLTYGLSGTDAAAFGITGAGALSLTSAADHEAQSSYSVNVRVRDSRNADGDADTAWDTTLALDVGVTDADEKPDAPTGVGAAGIANGLRVTWKAPDMARKPALEGYDVEHALRTAAAAGATPATWGAAATGAAGVVEAYEVTGLTPGSTYRVRVRARNDEGDSVWTPYVTGVPTTPPLVNAVPSFDEGAGTTRGVPENTAAGTAIGLPLTATDTDSDTLTYAIDSPNVSPGSHFGIDSATGQLKARGALNYESGTTSYAITVTVSDGKSGTDSIAVTITVDDVDEPPDRPAAPTVSPASTSSLNVRWSAPANKGPAITDYDHRYKKTSENSWTEVTGGSASTALTAVIASLESGASYDVQVRATNLEGTGDWSTTTSATTAAGVPGAPTGLTAAANGQTQIDLSWTAPASSGGAAISGYKLEVSADAGSTWSGLEDDTESTSTTHEHTGLTAGTTRHYRVSAINSAGTGAASSAASATTAAAGVPGAPTGLGATANGQMQIDLSWTAPAGTGGAPISGYKIEVSDDAGNTWSGLEDDTESTSTTHTHSGLTAGTTRHYRVSAINSGGTGAASSAASATTDAAAGVPGAPTGLTAAANGQTQIDLSWTAPASSGGAAISGYKLEVSADAGSTWSGLEDDTESTSTTHEHTGLTAGTTRHYRVSAINSAGTGAASSAASATTDGGHGARRSDGSDGDGEWPDANRPLLDSPRGHRRRSHQRLQDRGLRRCRQHLVGPGGRHRIHLNDAYPQRPDGRHDAALPRLGHQLRGHGRGLERGQRHHGAGGSARRSDGSGSDGEWPDTDQPLLDGPGEQRRRGHQRLQARGLGRCWQHLVGLGGRHRIHLHDARAHRPDRGHDAALPRLGHQLRGRGRGLKRGQRHHGGDGGAAAGASGEPPRRRGWRGYRRGGPHTEHARLRVEHDPRHRGARRRQRPAQRPLVRRRDALGRPEQRERR